MAHTGQVRVDQSNGPAVSGMGTFVAAFFVGWFTLLLALGSAGAFVTSSGGPPLALLIGFVAPLLVVLGGYRAVPSVRAFILSADLRVVVALQAWRWAGFGFLALHAFKVLPGIFAWPAGLGDMTIGATAPLVLMTLLRTPDFAASKSFAAWNVSGIVDLTVAMSIGAGGPLLIPNFYGTAWPDPMSHLPLVLVPTFFVPTFLMMHVTALLQARRLARAHSDGSVLAGEAKRRSTQAS